MTQFDELTLKKRLFIESFETAYGNVSMACKLTDISRQTYYNWVDTDPGFVETLSQVKPKQKLIDLAEHGLQRKLVDGDITAIIFTLKTLGKDRGYIERNELTGKDGTALTPFTWDRLYKGDGVQ